MAFTGLQNSNGIGLITYIGATLVTLGEDRQGADKVSGLLMDG